MFFFLELQNLDYIQLENIKKIDLSLDQVLKNNVALSYFIDFVSSQGKQTDLFFYLNIEGKCKNLFVLIIFITYLCVKSIIFVFKF